MLRRRSLRRVGARLALFAVWLQIVLALGHIHPWDIYLFGHPVVQGQGLTDVVADRHATPIPGAPLQANEATDLACSICISIAMTGSLVPPDPVKLPPPIFAAGHVFARDGPVLPAATAFLLFQSRAPPLA
jgi:hypothetical protein